MSDFEIAAKVGLGVEADSKEEAYDKVQGILDQETGFTDVTIEAVTVDNTDGPFGDEE